MCLPVSIHTSIHHYATYAHLTPKGDENGIENDNLEEEINQEAAEDCMLVEMDGMFTSHTKIQHVHPSTYLPLHSENFPLRVKIDDEDEQKNAIFKIIKKCFKGHTFSKPKEELTGFLS